MEIKKDKNLPDNWIIFESDNHKYIGIRAGNTSNMNYDIYDYDQKDINTKKFLFNARGNKIKAAVEIQQYEIAKSHLNNLCEIAVCHYQKKGV